jgi:membrane protease YdiL (CAAX protease family)
LKDLGKILTYFFGVIILGAFLAAPLYWAGQAVAARGVLTFLAKTDFQSFFNRGVLIAAIALLWPTVRWLQIGSVRELGLDLDDRRWRRCLAGFVIAGGLVLALGCVYVSLEIYRWKKENLPWGRLPQLLLSAAVVSLLEEGVFRGGILGLFRRSFSARSAVLLTSIIFAAVHFLKPDEEMKLVHISWSSGFELLPHVFHQFTEPMQLLGGFTTILVLALMLGDVTVRTRSLWMAIGLHAGVVFAKMSFSKFTKRDESHMPWVGESLEIGLVPVGVLLLAWLLARLWLRYVNRPSLPSRS